MQRDPMQGTKGNRAQLLGQQEKGVHSRTGGQWGGRGGEIGEVGKASLPQSGPVCFIRKAIRLSSSFTLFTIVD